MPERNQKNKSTHYSVLETLTSVLEGTGEGLAARALTWPSEWAYYQVAKKSNTLSYSTLFRMCFSLEMMRELKTSFVKAGIKPTVGKSFSTAGVYNMMELKFSYLNDQPLKKGLIASVFSAPLETYFTYKGEHEKIMRFHESKKSDSYILGKTEKNRFRAATFVRVLGTGFLTVSGIYQMKIWMKPFFPESTSESVKNGITAATAGGLVQVANMPFINYQTFAAHNLPLVFARKAPAFMPGMDSAGAEGACFNSVYYLKIPPLLPAALAK